MPFPTTEMLHDQAAGLDALPPAEVARRLTRAQCSAAAAVEAVVPQLCTAAGAMAASIRAGGRLIYAAAGSSGLMAAADALELGLTFGIPARQVRILMAGGMPTGVEMPGATEDDTDSAVAELRDAGPHDTMVAVSASGATPYTVAAAEAAEARGACIVGIANNPASKLLDLAHHSICLKTPPELLAGSTRMGAGTAQKIALNTLSTLMAVELGHVHDGMMVNLLAHNAKLRARAARMVSRIADVPESEAERALAATSGAVKAAVLLASGASSLDRAEALLSDANGNLRAAMGRL